MLKCMLQLNASLSYVLIVLNECVRCRRSYVQSVFESAELFLACCALPDSRTRGINGTAAISRSFSYLTV